MGQADYSEKPPVDLVAEVLGLREQIREGDPGTGFHELVGALADRFEHQDDALAMLAARYLTPGRHALNRSILARRCAIEAAVDAFATAAFALSPGGLILAANPEASREFDLGPGAVIGALGLTRADFDAFADRCRHAGREASMLLGGYMSNNRRLVLAGRRLPEQDAYLLTVVSWAWPDGLMDNLRRAFGLTAREGAVLDAMMSGQGAEDIAMRDGRSLGTVRQQIKAILSKLGVGAQAQAVALVAAAASAWNQLQQPAPIMSRSIDSRLELSTISRGNRTIGVRCFGRSDGAPVVLVHGALFGIGETLSERAIADAAGLRVLAAEKPGYGRTDPLPGHNQAEAMAQDVLFMMDRQGVERAVLIAHDIGTLVAFWLARLAPERIAAIVAAPATPPMLSWSQTADMPKAHRIHAWAAQRVPKLMDMLVALGLAQVQRQGVSILPELFFSGCDFDRETWSQPHHAAALDGTYRFIAAQEARGFRQDMLLTNVDWSDWGSQVGTPVELLHGALSRTVSRQAVEQVAARLPAGRFRIVEDAGHTMPLTHAGLIYEQAAAYAARAGLA
ncbi:alpha/beta fold hydrolase [Devosia sp.]|uniref:alpha/beta fold hydrolase n=1 Tax=Devosia sp. TaxID=1871048 RepID=UPI002AFF4C18|nr:alpha/beta fold hydrolase [Devosia sp.]